MYTMCNLGDPSMQKGVLEPTHLSKAIIAPARVTATRIRDVMLLNGAMVVVVDEKEFNQSCP